MKINNMKRNILDILYTIIYYILLSISLHLFNSIEIVIKIPRCFVPQTVLSQLFHRNDMTYSQLLTISGHSLHLLILYA